MIDRRTLIGTASSGSALFVAAMSLPMRASALGQGVASEPGGPLIDLGAAGVAPGNDARRNMINFQNAIDRAPKGAVLVLPLSQGVCRIDTNMGWRRAIQIPRRLSLRIDGSLQATHSRSTPSPAYLLNVTAAGVRISGAGRIIGDGAIDDANSGTDETMPGLIRVAADDFELTGLELVSPPKIGLLLYQCRRARIAGARFTGGPKVYRDTGHFAIRAAGGGDHLFEDNRFYPDGEGGMAVQCIMLSGSHRNRILRNSALRPFEKLVYGYGDYNVAMENTVEGNPGFIPGLDVRGTYTAVFRFHGSSNRVERNRTTFCAGGAQMMDGAGHIVVGNEFMSCGQSAITVYQSDLTGSVIRANIASRARIDGVLAGHGIYLLSDRGAADRVVIEDNQVEGFSVSDPLDAVAEWRGSARISANSPRKPREANGRYYIALNPGMTGSVEPRWPTTPQQTVRDGTVTWLTVAYEGGQANIALMGGGVGKMIAHSVVRRNRVAGGNLGIVTRFMRDSEVTANRIDARVRSMVDESGARNRWELNTLTGSSPGQVVRITPLRN